MTDEPRRLSIYQTPRDDPERGRFLAALVRQEWHEGLTYEELVYILTPGDTLRLFERGFPGVTAVFVADIARQWREALPVLSLPAVTALLEKGRPL